jgi:hypothetical protein
MNKIRILGLVAFAAFAGIPASAQFAYDDYKPSTLSEVFAIGENACGELDQYTTALVNGKNAFRVAASWNGETREISEDILAILSLHEDVKRPKLTKQVPFRDMFRTEVPVTHDGREFWLPIQEQILEAFKKEVGPVKQVTLYVLYFGCNAKKPLSVAVAIAEFQAAREKKP